MWPFGKKTPEPEVVVLDLTAEETLYLARRLDKMNEGRETRTHREASALVWQWVTARVKEELPSRQFSRLARVTIDDSRADAYRLHAILAPQVEATMKGEL